jgi:iron complex transport system substrate-binding protein
VFLSPRLPYGWVDAPPSLNRLIGLEWLARLLFPGRFPGDISPIARDFYRQFYQVDLSAPELNKLLEGAQERR